MAIRKFLLKAKPVAVILALKDAGSVWYPSRLAQNAGASYVYVTNWLSRLEKSGWVKMEKKGRLQTVTLTEPGMTVANALDEMVKKIEMAQNSAATDAKPAPLEIPAENAPREKGDGKPAEKKREGGEQEKGEKREKPEKEREKEKGEREKTEWGEKENGEKTEKKN